MEIQKRMSNHRLCGLCAENKNFSIPLSNDIVATHISRKHYPFYVIDKMEEIKYLKNRTNTLFVVAISFSKEWNSHRGSEANEPAGWKRATQTEQKCRQQLNNKFHKVGNKLPTSVPWLEGVLRLSLTNFASSGLVVCKLSFFF
jgi:hypothetical protein